MLTLQEEITDNGQQTTENKKMIDLSKEIQFQTTRSGGKGGQNVNKVETAVIASFHIDESQLLNDDQKILIKKN